MSGYFQDSSSTTDFSSEELEEESESLNMTSVRPRLDGIFDDVLQNLPCLDEDPLSDEDNDQEVAIFNRRLPDLHTYVLNEGYDSGLNDMGTPQPTSEPSVKESSTSPVYFANPPKKLMNGRHSDDAGHSRKAENIVRGVFWRDNKPNVTMKDPISYGLTEETLDEALDRIDDVGFEGHGDRRNNVTYAWGTPPANEAAEQPNDVDIGSVMEKLNSLANRQRKLGEKAFEEARQAAELNRVTLRGADEAIELDSGISMSAATGTSQTTTTRSTGASANFPMPQSRPQRVTLPGFHEPHNYDQTKVIDLTQSDNGSNIKATEVNVAAIERILNLSEKKSSKNSQRRKPSSPSSSEDEDEDGVNVPRLWHEERRLIKQQISMGNTPDPSKIRKEIKNRQEFHVRDTTLSAAELQPSADVQDLFDEPDICPDQDVPDEPEEKAFSETSASRARLPDNDREEQEAASQKVIDQKMLELHAKQRAQNERAVRKALKEAEQQAARAKKAPRVDPQADYEQELLKKKQLKQKQDAERASRIRLSSQLQSMQSFQMEKEGIVPAKNTEPLYHIEESYSAPISAFCPALTVPDVTGSSSNESQTQDLLLLTVKLDSPNHIALPDSPLSNNKKGNAVGSTVSRASTCGGLVALVAWLCSLVFNKREASVKRASPDESQANPHPNLRFTRNKQPVPFNVVAMQQGVFHSELVLQVVVTPSLSVNSLREMYLNKTRKKTKNSGSFFFQIVQKFLASFSLPELLDWKPYSVNGGRLPLIPSCTLSQFMSITGQSSHASYMFDIIPGFFWHSVNPEKDHTDQTAQSSPENMLTLVAEDLFTQGENIHGVLLRVLQLQLDLSGLRLLFPTLEQLNESVHYHNFKDFEYTLNRENVPVLALCVRGENATRAWTAAVGPYNPLLARTANPTSLVSFYGTDTHCHVFVPRRDMHRELTKFFGGRVRPNESLSTRETQLYSQFLEPKTTHNGDLDVAPPSVLCAVTPSAILLTVSSLVPFEFIPFVLAVCQRFGMSMLGLKRMYVDSKRATMMNIGAEVNRYFCDMSDPRLCTCILLKGENSVFHAATLVQNLFVEVRNLLNLPMDVLSYQLFHISHASASVVNGLHVRGSGPSSAGAVSSTGGFPANPGELPDDPHCESVCVVCFIGHRQMHDIGNQLGRLTGTLFHYQVGSTLSYQKKPPSQPVESLELLGVTHRPRLSKLQARELTLYEVGDSSYAASIEYLSANECVIAAVRGVDVFQRVQTLFNVDKLDSSKPLTDLRDNDVLMSFSSRESYKFLRLFFDDTDLFCDEPARVNAHEYPPTECFRSERLSFLHVEDVNCFGDKKKQPNKGPDKSKYLQITIQTESIYGSLLSGHESQNTWLLVKPMATQNHLVSILRTVCQESFSIVSLHLVTQLESHQIEFLHNSIDDEEDLSWVDNGPVCILALQRLAAVTALRNLIGPPDLLTARREQPDCWTAHFAHRQEPSAFLTCQSHEQSQDFLQYFFPQGLCTRKYKSLSFGVDPLLSQGLSGRMFQVSESGGRSLLNQVNLMLLPSNLLESHASMPHAVPPFIQILRQLASKGCAWLGMRMVWMSRAQAESVVAHLSCEDRQTSVNYLCNGASLAVALHRDNCVTCFDQLLGSPYEDDSCFSLYGKFIIRPKCVSEAHSLLPILFDQLISNSYGQISRAN